MSGQESLCRAERVQNDALSNRVDGLEGELSRMRRLATERGVVASNRSMEINELRDSLSRVEKALDSSPRQKPGFDGKSTDPINAETLSELQIQSPGATPLPVSSDKINESLNISGHDSRMSMHMIGSSSHTRRLDKDGPIRALPMPSLDSSQPDFKFTSAGGSSAKIHVSRRGSISITTGTPSVASVGSRVGPSPAATRVRERLSAVRKQFAMMKQKN